MKMKTQHTQTYEHNERGARHSSLSASTKQVERFPNNSNLTAHLETLKQKSVITPNRSRWQKIIKLRVEINKTETKKTTKRINET